MKIVFSPLFSKFVICNFAMKVEFFDRDETIVKLP